jgi:hypothetical protein
MFPVHPREHPSTLLVHQVPPANRHSDRYPSDPQREINVCEIDKIKSGIRNNLSHRRRGERCLNDKGGAHGRRNHGARGHPSRQGKRIQYMRV